jgi:flagellar biosynthetic protein FliO
MDDGLNFGLQFAKMAGGLAVVLAALLACAYALKRTGLWLRKQESESWLRILAQQTVGLKHQLILLRVHDQTLLVGISPQGIHLLTRIEGGAGTAGSVAPPLTEEPR